jgi:glucuronate isomerase
MMAPTHKTEAGPPLIHEDFLLDCDEAVRLYHEYADSLPIIDFHSHLPPEEIAMNKSWSNISQVWLDGDHYKWRAMRTNGVPEAYCTGEASDREKFDAFAGTLPYTLRNPLYHWSHLELARYFGIDDQLLGPDTADGIWERTSAVFDAGLCVNDLLRKSQVEVVCTTDDPADSLEHHAQLRDSSAAATTVLPAWRPDACLAFQDVDTFNQYLDRLAATAGRSIQDLADLLQALRTRHDFFHEMGCRLSDRGIDHFTFSESTEARATRLFARLRSGQALNAPEQCQLRSFLLLELARMDAAKGWTMQMHIGATRFNCTRTGSTLGYDSIDDRPYAQPLACFLDALDREQELPKTILYNLNPSHNEMIATMVGNFQDSSVPGKIQMGSGWWFLDQMDGMERQFEALSQMGLLRRFVGMVTDSRSFLSYIRHEYFRRVLCNILGRDMHLGRLPKDFELVGRMVADVSYHNPAAYFGFPTQNNP